MKKVVRRNREQQKTAELLDSPKSGKIIGGREINLVLLYTLARKRIYIKEKLWTLNFGQFLNTLSIWTIWKARKTFWGGIQHSKGAANDFI